MSCLSCMNKEHELFLLHKHHAQTVLELHYAKEEIEHLKRVLSSPIAVVTITPDGVVELPGGAV